MGIDLTFACHSGTDQLFERRFLHRIVLMNVDGPSCSSFEARIEEMRGVFQRGPVKEGQLDNLLVGFTRADAPVVGPDGSSRGRCFLPLPFLDNLGVRLVDERAHPFQH
jgi:hypothetical protein